MAKRDKLIVSQTVAKNLAKIYYTASHPASFSSLDKLWKATGTKVPKKIVAEWLRGQDTYTLHKPRRVKFPRNRYLLSNIGDLWECDLAEFTETYSRENDGVKYLLGWSIFLLNFCQ